MHYYAPPFPDAIAGEFTDYTVPYAGTRDTCDGGGSTTYYTRLFMVHADGFTPDTTRNSASVVINNHC